jgi:hypothetical protein
VHDLVVDRDAERRRKHAIGDLVALERRDGALLARELLGDAVEILGRDAGRTIAFSSASTSATMTLAARMISISSGPSAGS